MDLPTLADLGSALVAAILMSAMAGVAISWRARGDAALILRARWSMKLTHALIAAAIFVLAYAFQVHDFRLRYVAHTSDRSMPWTYLITALWGGQDGSLLWWIFILSVYARLYMFTRPKINGPLLTANRLEPVSYLVIQSIYAFFAVLMIFAANPFAEVFGAVPLDGEGLNPLLQNYWMAIHPPTLYSGLIGWSIPFAICVAAMVEGVIDEWVVLARRWTLTAWALLTLGNLLGMFWSYEELGWGGYWAWDPVENASFMPWLTGTAYVHSVMVQERRPMLRVWNVGLMLGTFFLTIFGTFLTRSGLIASVHAFARTDIGNYFLAYLIFLAVFSIGLIVYRRRELAGKASLESLLSREYSILFNNWILLGMTLFVMIATMFPKISEWIRGEVVTIGPQYFNTWMAPLGIVLLLLMGIGPLIAWRKSTGKDLARAFIWPSAVTAVVIVLQFIFGERLGYPALVGAYSIYTEATGDQGVEASTWTGLVLQWISAARPVACFAAVAFVLTAVTQEFVRGALARQKSAKENFTKALLMITLRARRRYGGYLVHVGIALMYVGFVGAAYDQDNESVLNVGETLEVGGYRFEHRGIGVRTDMSKEMTFARLNVTSPSGAALGMVHPAKFRYRSHPDMPTTEVAIQSTPRNDLYVILSTVDRETQRATFRVIVRPLVFWIWFGGVFAVLGAVLAGFPQTKEVLAWLDSFSKDDKEKANPKAPLQSPVPAGAAALVASKPDGEVTS